VVGNAKDLWESLGHESLLNSYEEYNDFLQGRRKATFIRFKNLKELPNPIKAKTFAQIIGKKRMPQQGMYLTKEMAQQLLSAGGAVTPLQP
jgi:predicted transcriptional regulator